MMMCTSMTIRFMVSIWLVSHEACEILCMQRFHRSRNFRRALIKERTNQKRAVRIRLHQLTLYVMDTEVSHRIHFGLC
jgi:hypothetical protein